MIVVTAIIGVVTTIIFTSRASFNSTVILSNTAYDVALTIRGTQNYGIGSRLVSGTGGAGYGVHFAASAPGTFSVFADTYPAPSASGCHPAPRGDTTAPDAHPGDCMLTTNDAQAAVQTYDIGNSITVSNFCAHRTDGSWWCANSGSRITDLYITFVRPNADMTIRTNRPYPAHSYTDACVEFVSPQGGARYVRVEQSGRVGAQSSSCMP